MTDTNPDTTKVLILGVKMINIPLITMIILIMIIISLIGFVCVLSSDLCHRHGHKIGGGYYNNEGGEYFNVQLGAIDGIDRVHCQLYTECKRCGEKFQVGKMHLPLLDDYTAEKLKKSRIKK